MVAGWKRGCSGNEVETADVLPYLKVLQQSSGMFVIQAKGDTFITLGTQLKLVLSLNNSYSIATDFFD